MTSERCKVLKFLLIIHNLDQDYAAGSDKLSNILFFHAFVLDRDITLSFGIIFLEVHKLLLDSPFLAYSFQA